MLLQLVKRLIASKRTSRHTTRLRFRPTLEALETRAVPVVNFTVNTLGDKPDIFVGDGFALDEDGNTSLRAAIEEGNEAGEAVAINFDAKLFPNNTPGTIVLGSALDDLEENLTITGPGSSKLAVVRDTNQDPFRLVTISDDTLTCSIQGVTLAKGNSDGIGSGGAILNAGSLTLVDCVFMENESNNGGAIYNSGTLSASACTFVSNGTINGLGGAIFNEFGTLTLSLGCSLTQNSAATWGGAIYNGNDGSVTIQGDTQISGNSAALGGGIYNQSGQVTMNGGYIGYNQASENAQLMNSARGGGYYGAGGSASFEGVNFDTNSADNRGGGFYVEAGSFTINTCTISGNTSPTGPGGYVELNVTYTRESCTVNDVIVVET